jgi:hypothetical protein
MRSRPVGRWRFDQLAAAVFQTPAVEAPHATVSHHLTWNARGTNHGNVWVVEHLFHWYPPLIPSCFFGARFAYLAGSAYTCLLFEEEEEDIRWTGAKESEPEKVEGGGWIGYLSVLALKHLTGTFLVGDFSGCIARRNGCWVSSVVFYVWFVVEIHLCVQ